MATYAPGALALALCLIQLTAPHALTGVHGFNGPGWDDGVYLGASFGIVSGHVPYKDFVLMHPPGVPLLMVPVALLGKLVGLQAAMVVARLLTAVVTGANAVLAAMCVRHRGPAAMAAAGLLLACWPLAPSADRTLMLEPYLVLFCLLGVLAMFPKGQLAEGRRMMLAGAAFGFAATVKIWAVLVIVIALATCLGRRKAALNLGAGVAVGVGVPCLPFLLLAPTGFVRQVVTDQFFRLTPGNSQAGTPIDRLLDLTGLSGLTVFHAAANLAVLVIVVVGLGIAFVFGLRFRALTRFDWMVAGCCLTIASALFEARVMYVHYTYFLAPFVAMLTASTLALAVASESAEEQRQRRLTRLPLVVAVALAIFLVPQQMFYARQYVADATDTAETIQAIIPPGACVVADQITTVMVADRFEPKSPSCPFIVDAYGMWIDTFPAHLPPYSGADVPSDFSERWKNWFARADYVVLLSEQSIQIPWSPDLRSWFDTNFEAVHLQPGVVIFRNRVSPGGDQDRQAPGGG